MGTIKIIKGVWTGEVREKRQKNIGPSAFFPYIFIFKKI
jgi:hypothetical protein